MVDMKMIVRWANKEAKLEVEAEPAWKRAIATRKLDAMRAVYLEVGETEAVTAMDTARIEAKGKVL